MVTSKPKRISVAAGVVHIIILLNFKLINTRYMLLDRVDIMQNAGKAQQITFMIKASFKS